MFSGRITHKNIVARTLSPRMSDEEVHPGQVAQLVGASSHMPKDCRFDSWSGYIFGLHVQSPVRGTCRKKLIDVSLSLSLSNQ